MEITADVADAARSLIVEQVTNGVAIRMAVLYLLLSGAPVPSSATAGEFGPESPPESAETRHQSDPTAEEVAS
jgi:aspartate carbamoyltransferase catalytic subunit